MLVLMARLFNGSRKGVLLLKMPGLSALALTRSSIVRSSLNWVLNRFSKLLKVSFGPTVMVGGFNTDWLEMICVPGCNKPASALLAMARPAALEVLLPAAAIRLN